jgi:hypothetical protein
LYKFRVILNLNTINPAGFFPFSANPKFHLLLLAEIALLPLQIIFTK